MACSGLPYTCLLLRMCNAYVRDRVVCFYISHTFTVPYFYWSPVWPTYDLLHVLHWNLYIPLDFVLFCGDLSHNWLYMVLHVRKAMFRSVRLNRLVTFCISGLGYGNVIHFFLCVCVGAHFVFCVLFILFFVLWMMCNGKPLFPAMVQIVSHSRCLACSVIGIDIILFI